MAEKKGLFVRFYRSSKFKISMWNAFFLLLFITFFASYLYFYIQKTLIDEAKVFLRDEAQDMATQIIQEGVSPNIEQWFNDKSNRSDYGMSYAIFDKEGKIVSSFQYPNLPDAFDKISTFLRKNPDEIFFGKFNMPGIKKDFTVAASPVLDKVKRIRYIALVSSDLNFINKRLLKYGRIIQVVLPGSFFFALFAGWILSGIMLIPVQKVTKRIEAITSHNLNEHIPLKGTGDEFDRLAQTFNEMMGRLSTAYEKISQFTAGASHELKTPIAVMKNEIEVFLRRKRNAEEYETLLYSHMEELDRLTRLIESLLFLTKADSESLKHIYEKVHLNDLFQEVAELFEPVAESKGIRFRLEPCEHLCVSGDESALRQLLFNLTDNAIKYSHEGGEVSLQAQQKNGKVTISIKDTGLGIEKEDIPKIFDRFYRGDSSRSSSVPGHGLGLSICKVIAQAHGGNLSVVSALNQGSEFSFELPLV